MLSCVRLFATPWTVVNQTPLSVEFSRQESWSGLPSPSNIKAKSLTGADFKNLTQLGPMMWSRQAPAHHCWEWTSSSTKWTKIPAFMGWGMGENVDNMHECNKCFEKEEKTEMPWKWGASIILNRVMGWILLRWYLDRDLKEGWVLTMWSSGKGRISSLRNI